MLSFVITSYAKGQNQQDHRPLPAVLATHTIGGQAGVGSERGGEEVSVMCPSVDQAT